MRKFIALFMLTGLLPLTTKGQEPGDSSVYNPGIRMIRDSRTANDYIQAAAYFEDATVHKQVQWLEYYYAGLSYIQASYRAESDKARDALMDKAQPCIDKAFRLKPDDPELMVLQAFLYQSRIQVNPEMRGMSYSMKADAMLKKAASADDRIPRTWSLMGYNIFHTPAIFGGGPRKALPLFLKARDKYLSFKPLLPFMPMWGEPENENMIAECRKSLK